jgi:hypothetical protein
MRRLSPFIFQGVLSLFLLVAGPMPAMAQTTVREWQVKTVQKYPQLGIGGSELNKRFIAEYLRRVAADPDFLKNPQWPMILADELAAAPAPNAAKASQALPAPDLAKPAADKSVLDPWRERWKMSSPATRYLAIFGFVVALASLVNFVLRRIARRFRWRRICAGAETYLAQLADADGLPRVPAHLALQADERVFYCAASSLFEPRSWQLPFGPGTHGFHLSRGIWIGGSRSESITRSRWEKLDAGSLTVTNQRVVFEGTSESVTIPIKRVERVTAMRDAVDLAISGRKKDLVFEAANPLLLAAVIHLTQGGHDARLRSAYVRAHGAAGNGAPGNTGTAAGDGYGAWHGPPPPRSAHSRGAAPSMTMPEPEEASHARILGLAGAFGFAEVKKAYHERMKEYHPDRVAGLGPKLREVAEIESKKINAAYEFFRRRFGAGRVG